MVSIKVNYKVVRDRYELKDATGQETCCPDDLSRLPAGKWRML